MAIEGKYSVIVNSPMGKQDGAPTQELVDRARDYFNNPVYIGGIDLETICLHEINGSDHAYKRMQHNPH